MPSGTRTAMKVTTVRFGPDLWRLLEAEAANAGVSVSQYIREAGLARAAAAASARGEGPFELLAGALREVARDEPDSKRRAEIDRVLAALARLTAEDTMVEAHALQAESEQAALHAKNIAGRSDALVRSSERR